MADLIRDSCVDDVNAECASRSQAKDKCRCNDATKKLSDEQKECPRSSEDAVEPEGESDCGAMRWSVSTSKQAMAGVPLT